MTLEQRVAQLERQVAELQRSELVRATAIGLARWFGPLFVSAAAVIAVILK